MKLKEKIESSTVYVKLRRKIRKQSYTKVVAFGYFVMLIIGTFLLTLPVSSKAGTWTNFADALTTATSASCVTGLIVYDTFSHWTIFGQLVILVLIQIGGLGYMSIIALFSVIIGRKIGLRERTLLKESTNSMYVGGLISLTKKAIVGTIFFEVVGAVLLSTQFVGEFGVRRGIYYGIFHSVSAFCNAGFDLMGCIEPYSSLTYFNRNPVVMFTIMTLIVVGGIGFIVWDDIWKHKLNLLRYKLHSKIVLVTSAALIIVGAVVIYIMEYDNTFKGMDYANGVMNALFASVTTRTAGFNSVDTAAFTSGTTLLNIVYMLVGGSPGSTAGGMKTTTLAVLVISMWASMRNSKNVNVFDRRLQSDIIKKALTVAMIYFTITLVSSVLICMSNTHLTLAEVLFEVTSAIGTVGLTQGAMGKVNLFGQMLLTLLMYCGRVGSLSFAMIFTEMKTPSAVRMPTEKIIIG